MNLRKIIHFAIGPLGGAAISFITIPFLASIFTAEDIGKYNFFQIILSFSLLLFVLGLDQAYVREFHESRDHAQLLKACLMPGFILLSLTGTIALAFSSKLSNLLYDTSSPLEFWITLACIFISFISRFLSLILRMQERGLAFSMSQIIPKILLLIILSGILLFDLSRSFLTLIFSFLASSIFVMIAYLWNTKDQWKLAVKTKYNSKQVRNLLHFGTPLIFSGLAYWGLVATSSIALRSFSTFSELGIYSITTSVAGIAVIFQSIFSVVWAPIVYKWAAEGVDTSRIERMTGQALAVVCAVFLICGTLSWLTDYVLPAQYVMVKYLVLCAIVQPLLYTLSEITSVGIGITRRTILTVWVTVGALCTNVLLSIWLVPVHGAAGAVTANSVAYLVFFIGRTEASAFVWHSFPRRRLYIFLGLAVALSVATVALGPTLPIHYSLIWLALAPIVIWFFRMELADIISAARHAVRLKTDT